MRESGHPTHPNDARFEARRQESLVVITPDMLMADNRSPEAKYHTDEWNRIRREHEQLAKWFCDDARTDVQDPDQSVIMRSIATGGDVHAFAPIIESPNIKATIVKTHLNGATIAPRQRPTGCGGQAAKEAMMASGERMNPPSGIGRYVRHDITHYDPIIQSIVTAERVAKLGTGKPVLAATQDHRTGKVYPLVALLEQGGILVEIKPLALAEFLHDGTYNPQEIYTDGIPSLSTEALPAAFRDFSSENEERVRELVQKYPNLYERQGVQNPGILHLTSLIRPPQTMYPDTFDRPGSAFEITVPRIKHGRQLSLPRLQMVFDQVEYPISHALENQENPNGDFRHLNTIFIETEAFDASQYVAEGLVRQFNTQEWLHLPQRHILIGENKRGKATRIEQFV